MRAFIAALSLSLLLPVSAAARPGSGGPFGLGVILGETSGLTGKLWVSPEEAFDFHLAENPFSSSGVGVYGDYLSHIDLEAPANLFIVAMYLGPGAAVFFDNESTCIRRVCYHEDPVVWLAARMPIGFNMLFTRFNGEVFAEVAPSLVIYPFVGLDVDISVGFRFYFPDSRRYLP